MVHDSNWRIRKQFCSFTFRVFAPLKEYKEIRKRPKTLSEEEERSSFKRIERRNTLENNRNVVSKRASNVYYLFKAGWARSIFEILTDSEPQVVLEGLNVMQEYHFAFKKKNFVDYFKPHFERTLLNVSLPTSSF
jgi:hypothetical protein